MRFPEIEKVALATGGVGLASLIGMAVAGIPADIVAASACVLGVAQRRIAGGPRSAINPAKASYAGKTIVITGAGSGVGFAAATLLAKTRANIVVACRLEQQAREMIDAITKKQPSARLIPVGFDLSSVRDVDAGATSILRLLADGKISSIDVLINNAGVLSVQPQRTRDGLDIHLAVNHLAPMLLTERLLPALKASQGRIINVNSVAHRGVNAVDWASPTPIFDRVVEANRRIKELTTTSTSSKSPSSPPISRTYMPEYGLSKALNLLYTKDLATRLDADARCGVKVVSLHPGGVSTNIFRDLGVIRHLLTAAAPVFLKTPHDGAQTVIQCALSPELQNGSFYVDCGVRDDLVDQRLFEHAEDLQRVMQWSRETIDEALSS